MTPAAGPRLVRAMSAPKLALTVFSILFVSIVTAGCGDDLQSKVTCSDDSACRTKAGTIFADDAGVDSLPRCCGGTCVLPAGGCDSGFRYLTSAPGYGECVAMPSCPAPAADMSIVDLAMPKVDMSKKD